MNRKKYVALTFLVLFVNLFLDRITKMGALTYLKGEGINSYFFDTIRVIYIENTGAFLGMGNSWPIFIKYLVLIIIPCVFCLLGLYYCFFKTSDIKMNILIVTIIGGGLGNLIDRILYDFSVIDFLNFGIGSFRSGILNVADLSVTFGAIFLIYYEYSKKPKSVSKP